MTAAADPPRIWILWRRRKGDLDQMMALVDALGMPYIIKRLDFVPPDIPALAPLLLKRNSDSLSPPWPDLVVCAEALPSIIATSLKAKSKGHIKMVCLARPAGSPASFDLVITTAQYRLPAAANILELAMPLGAPPAFPTRQTASEQNRIAVAVGGSSFPDRLDTQAAGELATRLLAYAEEKGAIIEAVTSPRTAPDAAQTLRAALPAPHRVHIFGAEPANPYRDVLAGAREIVVTSDSVSMVADALATGKPVAIYRLPQTRNMQWRLMEWLYANAVLEPRRWMAPVAKAFAMGLIESTADRHLLFDRLVREGRVGWFGDARLSQRSDLSSDDLAMAVARVKALLD